jgi:hypothetical protein
MIAEKYEDAASYGKEAMSSVQDYLHRGTDQMAHFVDERPGVSVMTACLAGFAVGLMLSQMFNTEERSYTNSFDRSSAERFGRNLLDRIEHAMPAMLRERLMK